MAWPVTALELWMPSWTPGSYLIREYARNVQAVRAEGADGQPLALERMSEDSWRVACTAVSLVRARPLLGLRLRSLGAHELSGREPRLLQRGLAVSHGRRSSGPARERAAGPSARLEGRDLARAGGGEPLPRARLPRAVRQSGALRARRSRRRFHGRRGPASAGNLGKRKRGPAGARKRSGRDRRTGRPGVRGPALSALSVSDAPDRSRARGPRAPRLGHPALPALRLPAGQGAPGVLVARGPRALSRLGGEAAAPPGADPPTATAPRTSPACCGSSRASPPTTRCCSACGQACSRPHAFSSCGASA